MSLFSETGQWAVFWEMREGGKPGEREYRLIKFLCNGEVAWKKNDPKPESGGQGKFYAIAEVGGKTLY